MPSAADKERKAGLGEALFADGHGFCIPDRGPTRSGPMSRLRRSPYAIPHPCVPNIDASVLLGIARDMPPDPPVLVVVEADPPAYAARVAGGLRRELQTDVDMVRGNYVRGGGSTTPVGFPQLSESGPAPTAKITWQGSGMEGLRSGTEDQAAR